MPALDQFTIGEGVNGWYIADPTGQVWNLDYPFKSEAEARAWLAEPWNCETVKFTRAGDKRILINGEPPKVHVRIMSDENFHKAKWAINRLIELGELSP